MVAEKVVVQLVLDTSRYSSKAVGAARDTAKIQTAADKTSKSVSGLGATALKAGAALGAAFAAKAALDFAKSSIAAFSNLEESVNAIEVAFGTAAEGVFALGENSAEQFGLSTRAVNEAAVAMSAFADKIDEADPAGAFGNVLQRATDFASVMNIDIEESLLLFRSGLAGESEPLRKFGIDVSAATVNLVGLEAGLGGANGKLDEGEKVQARYLAIMQQTEKTAGDFANTSDGLANSQRILSAKWEEAQVLLGKKLAPAMTTLLKAGTDLIPVFLLVVDVFGEVIEQATPLIELLGEGATLLGLWADAADDADGATGFLGDSVGVLKDAFFGLIDPVGTITGGIQELRGHFSDADDAANPFVSTLDLMAAREKRVAEEADLMAGLLPIAKTATEKAGVAAQTAAERFQAEADAIRDVGRAQAESASPLLRLLRLQGNVTKATEALNEARKDEEATARDVVDAELSAIEAQIALEIATAESTGAIAAGTQSFLDAAANVDILKERARELIDTIGELPTTVEIDFFATVRGFERVEQLLGNTRGGSLRSEVRRHGGPVTAGEPFIVGEAGPELFIPDQAGRIIPNQAGGEQSIIVNVNNPTTVDLAADLSAGLIAAQITQQVELIRV